MLNNKAVDMWSVGLITFMLLNKGKHPIKEISNKKLVIKTITKSEIDFDVISCNVGCIISKIFYKKINL